LCFLAYSYLLRPGWEWLGALAAQWHRHANALWSDNSTPNKGQKPDGETLPYCSSNVCADETRQRR